MPLTKESKYNVTIGLCITKAGTERWFDKGLVYSDLSYDQAIAIQDLVDEYNAEIEAAMKALRKDLLEAGYTMAIAVNPDAAGAKEVIKEIRGKGRNK